MLLNLAIWLGEKSVKGSRGMEEIEEKETEGVQ